MTAAPRVSVVMAVYNAAGTVARAMDGILTQSFGDFEFIVIDDGSDDGTAGILARYAARDGRIRVVTQANAGLTVSLNRGLAIARGYYIARQDADDFSYPDRLEKQVALMDANPSIVLCGGNCDNVYAGGLKTRWGWDSDAVLHKTVFYKTPFAHSTAMMRADAARKLGGYDESFEASQDMEFWMRFAGMGTISMIHEPVIERHVSPGSISVKKRRRQFYDACRARWKHGRGHKALVVYYSLRVLILSALPEKIIAIRQGFVK